MINFTKCLVIAFPNLIDSFNSIPLLNDCFIFKTHIRLQFSKSTNHFSFSSQGGNTLSYADHLSAYFISRLTSPFKFIFLKKSSSELKLIFKWQYFTHYNFVGKQKNAFCFLYLPRWCPRSWTSRHFWLKLHWELSFRKQCIIDLQFPELLLAENSVHKCNLITLYFT